MCRSLLSVALCLVLWQSGELSVGPPLVSQGAILEYRVVWCGPTQTVIEGTTQDVPLIVRIQAQIRMEGVFRAWQDVEQLYLPRDLEDKPQIEANPPEGYP